MGYLFCDNNEAVLLPRYIFVRITLLTRKKWQPLARPNSS